MKLNKEKQLELSEKGWVTFDSVLDFDTIDILTSDLEKAYKKCREIQIKNGVGNNTDGALHHLVCFKQSFLSFLDNLVLQDYITDYFSGKFILNSFGGVKNIKNNLSYVGNIHRDIKTYSGNANLMINMLVMLDDFTIDNGATFFLSGSHNKMEKPNNEEFYYNCERGVGKRGSVILFNSNLWHAAGVNKTNFERRALTLTFSKPFIKQQLDYPDFFGDQFLGDLSKNLIQILGFNSRIPTSLDEWYQPTEKRLYHADQD